MLNRKKAGDMGRALHFHFHSPNLKSLHKPPLFVTIIMPTMTRSVAAASMTLAMDTAVSAQFKDACDTYTYAINVLKANLTQTTMENRALSYNGALHEFICRSTRIMADTPQSHPLRAIVHVFQDRIATYPNAFCWGLTYSANSVEGRLRTVVDAILAKYPNDVTVAIAHEALRLNYINQMFFHAHCTRYAA
jgi:hypothetical protein